MNQRHVQRLSRYLRYCALARKGRPSRMIVRLSSPLIALLAALALGTGSASAKTQHDSADSCPLKPGGIEHVIYIQFDNVHLRPDVPGVASDLEQMPHLLNFLKDNGTVLNKHYTVLISHTAGGILSSLTGLYPDRMGITVSNSYDYYRSDNTPTFTSAFKYWTAPVAGGIDDLPNMVNGDSGKPKNAPAPWVTYARAGCDVGNVSAANTVLENNNAVVTPATTLSVSAAAGAMNIKVASVSGYVPGQTVQVQNEFVPIHSVGTAGANGSGITLASGLTQAHASGSQVIRVDPTGDMTTIFGNGSAQWTEGKNSQLAAPGTAARALAQTDFVGIAVHCANSATSICNGNPNAKVDSLPDEPGGYAGFQALFGAKYVNPVITGGSTAVKDINGNPITDPFGQPGFPGFDSMSAATTLGYIAQMQESGIPVTFAYISDVHDNHAGGGAYGPGEKGYVDALAAYDAAFVKFFDRLAAAGISKSNTLFVVTADENDHFAGQNPNVAPFNQNCDGVTKPCLYNTASGLANSGNPAHGIFDVTTAGTTPFTAPLWPPAGTNGPLVGEMGYNLKWAGLLGTDPAMNGTGYDISFDSAPSFYINGQPQAVDANGTIVLNATLRAFEQKVGSLVAFDPYFEATRLTPVARYLVDAPTLKAIHMINADSRRTMSFTMFAQPDYFFQTSSPCMPFPNAPNPSQGCLSDSFAWIHGDYSNDIGQTWLGVAGPGVKSGGIDDTTWTDHTDIVPTMMQLLGLAADYQPDGRVITQILAPSAAKGGNGASFTELGDVYKQLNAPYGAFAHSLIVASTNGIKANDAIYLQTERAIQSLAAQRDEVVQQMRDLLDGSSNGHAEQLIRQGRSLLQAAQALGGE